jgi:hypothetical protein
MFPTPSSTSNSKRTRVVKGLCFIGLVCIAACLFQYWFERKIILGSESSAAYKVHRILYSDEKNEIPIIGPSTAQGGLIPGILGPNFFNYGIDGVQDDVMQFFLKEECKKTNANSHIVLVFTLSGFNYALGDINSYILDSDNPDVRDLIGKYYKPYYRIPLIKYYGLYDSYLKDFLNERMMLTKFKDRGASVEKNALVPEKFNALVEERKETIGYYRNDSSLEQKFVGLIRSHPEKSFIILIPPLHPSFFYNFKNYGDAQHYLFYLSQFPNIHVLNYSQHFYPDSCYINTTHLNYKGAVLFNNLIRDTLQKIIAE